VHDKKVVELTVLADLGKYSSLFIW
jgi:hypothetical protein